MLCAQYCYVWPDCLRQSVTSLATVPEAPTPTIPVMVDIETVGAQSLSPKKDETTVIRNPGHAEFSNQFLAIWKSGF